MKTVLTLIVLILMSGCASQAMEDGATATQALYSETSGMSKMIKGKIMSCSLITNDKAMERVENISFNSDGSCTITVNTGKK